MKLKIACSLRSRLVGLRRYERLDGALLLVPCRDIHTFGMKRPIDVAFVASDGTVLESHLAVAPRKRLRNRRASATLERYASEDAWYMAGDIVEMSFGDCPQNSFPSR